MKKVSFNEGTLTFDKNKVSYEVPLEKTNIYSIDEIDFIKNVPFMFPITNLELSENDSFLVMELEVEKNYLPLGVFKSHSSEEEKYQFIKHVCETLIELESFEEIVTVLDDKNILVHSQNQELKFLYRGVTGLMPPVSYNTEELVEQVKRLALYILTAAKYDELRVNGLDAAFKKVSKERYKLVSKIYQCETLTDMLNVLNKFACVEEDVTEKEIEVEKRKISFLSSSSSVEVKVNKGNSNNIESVNVENRRVTKHKGSIIDRYKLKIAVGAVALILVVGVFNFFSNGENNKLANANIGLENQDDEGLLITGLQYAAVQDYAAAAENFGKIKSPFNELNESNKRAILFSFLMAGEYEEAIKKEPEFAYSVISYLVSVDNLAEVKNINSNEPIIVFEKAAINKDFETVIQYKDQVKLDGRRESIIVDSLIGLNKFDDAFNFAKAKGNTDLMTKVENIKNEKNQQEPDQGGGEGPVSA